MSGEQSGDLTSCLAGMGDLTLSAGTKGASALITKLAVHVCVCAALVLVCCHGMGCAPKICHTCHTAAAAAEAQVAA